MQRLVGMAVLATIQVLIAGCGGVQSAPTDAARAEVPSVSNLPTTAPSAQDRVRPTEPSEAPVVDPWIAGFPSDAAVHASPITWMALQADGRLSLGFGDGTLGTLASGQQSSAVTPVSRMETGPVLAVSADGTFAVVASDPPQVARTADGAQVLRLNAIPRIEGAAFVDALDVLYVVEPGGRLHIWQNVSALRGLPLDRIEAFMNRQLPDFTANMGALQGPVAVDEAGRIAFVTQDQQLGFWDPASPTSLRTLARLDGGAVSIAFVGEDILSIDRAGTLRIVGPGRTGGRPWTRGTTWRCGSTIANGNRGFFVAEDRVAMVDLADGRVLWQQPILLSSDCTVRMVSTFAVVQSGRVARVYRLTAQDAAAAASLVFRSAQVDVLTAQAVP